MSRFISDEELSVVLEALVPAKMAMSFGITDLEAARILGAMLPILDRTMPPELMAQDKRIIAAQELLQRLAPPIPVLGVAN